MRAENHEQDQRHRDDPDGHQRQLGVGGEQDDQRGGQQDERADQLQQALAQEQADFFHIVGGADHQLTGLVLVVIRERQALDLGIQIVAQVIGHGLRIPLRPVGLQEGEHAVHDPKNHQEDPGYDQIVRRVGFGCG